MMMMILTLMKKKNRFNEIFVKFINYYAGSYEQKTFLKEKKMKEH